MILCLEIKTGLEVGRWDAARGLAGHQSVGGEQLFSLVSLVFLGFYFSFFVIFLFIRIIYYYYNY